MGFLLTYQDLILLPTFEDRFNYLKVNERDLKEKNLRLRRMDNEVV